jgi:uncharacterized membrane protein
MNGAYLSLAATWVFTAFLLIIQPWLTRKNVLFGVVFGSDDIWKDETAKQIRLRYLCIMISGTVLLSMLGVLYIIIDKPSDGTAVTVYFIGIAALFVLGTVTFIVFHAFTRAFKAGKEPDANLVSEKICVETSMTDRQTVISTTWLLLILPVLLAAYGVALFGYSAMPANIPIHYSFTLVDAWAPKSWINVILPLLIGTAVTVLLLVCCLFTRRAPASVRGNPNAAPDSFRFRKYIIIILIVLSLLLETSILLTEVGFLVPISPLWFNIPSILSVLMTAMIFYIYFRFVRVKKPKGLILDDDAKWVLGMFYYSPSDPSTFVEKRTGIGYTLNFAKPAGWIILIGIIVFVIVTIFASAHS